MRIHPMNWQCKTFNQLSNIELYQILQLRSDVFVIEQQCIYRDMDNKDLLASHLFLSKDNQIIAYCRLLPKGVSVADAAIGRVIIHEKYRGRHLAHKMMGKAIDIIIHEWHENKIYVQAQEYLQGFYQSLGFKATSDVYLEDEIPHLDMYWES